MNTQKYTIDTKDFVVLKNGTKLFRIIAEHDIITPKLTVLAGDKGGYVGGERNLSQKGNSWIAPNCIVRDDAFVCGDAVVSGKSEVWGEAYISGDARVSHSRVCDNVVVRDESIVSNCNLAGDRCYGAQIMLDGLATGNVDEMKSASVYDEVFTSTASMQR